MVALKDISKGSSKKATSGKKSNSEKELQHLRRLDLLELLMDEIRQNEQNSAKLEELTELTDRLKAKLDDKDAQIEHLKQRLDAKDATIAQLEERAARLADAGGMVSNPYELAEIERRVLDEYFSKKMASARHAG